MCENVLEDLNANGGLWSSRDHMDRCISLLSSAKKQLAAVKNQIKVRKELLEQKADITLFAFSSAKKILPISILKDNLLKITEDSHFSYEGDKIHFIVKDPTILIGKDIAHCWSDNTGDKWWDGQITGYS